MIRVAVVYHSETGNTEHMARLIAAGAQSIPGVEAKTMSIDNVDTPFIESAHAVIFGSPTYEGSMSWQMKRFIDEFKAPLRGKLGGVFASQNWPGGGGASFAEMTLIAGLLVRGMMVYSGGITEGVPFLHFGAVSARAPKDELYAKRCHKLGENIARRCVELYAPKQS
ncbi:MAG TPA: flavodoxin family protein [Candidatus Brocadiia bacterium]|nr:flavodoxin family protein [Candidatus Brocadiia bacterium]